MADNAALIDQVFKRFDTNGDGKISASEVGDALKTSGGNVSEEDIKSRMAAIDTDGDGFISFKEFSDFVATNSAALEGMAKLFGMQ